MIIPYVFAFGTGVLASVLRVCPGGGRPPCPDPVMKVLAALLFGGISTAAYVFLFSGKRAIECCDLIAIAVLAYLFTHFFWTLFFEKKAAQ